MTKGTKGFSLKMRDKDNPLTDKEVLEIRRSKKTYSEIAKEHNLSGEYVFIIKQRLCKKHIYPELKSFDFTDRVQDVSMKLIKLTEDEKPLMYDLLKYMQIDFTIKERKFKDGKFAYFLISADNFQVLLQRVCRS